MRRAAKYSVSFFFLMFGTMALIMLFISGAFSTKTNGWSHGNAVVETMDSSSSLAYVNYTYEETDYTHVKLDSYDSSWYVGETLDILINPSSPTQVTCPDVSDSFKVAIMSIMMAGYYLSAVSFIGITMKQL